MTKPTDDRPCRNGIPLVSKRRWEQGERGGLRRISRKRQAALKDMAMNIPKNERQCELLPLLTGVVAWHRFREAYHPCSPLWSVHDRHHVWGNRTSCDEPWNLVIVCRPVHDFCESCWQQAGKLVSMIALHRAGRLDPAAMKANIKPDPLWQVEHWLDNEKLFDREAVLKLYAIELLDYYGRSAT